MGGVYLVAAALRWCHLAPFRHIFSLVNIRRLVCRQLNKQAREQACVIKVCHRPAETFLNT